MKNWELCPKCNGSGFAYNPSVNAISSVCDVCSGKKIINSFTGLPPDVKVEKPKLTIINDYIY
jgi:hypothetical protein